MDFHVVLDADDDHVVFEFGHSQEAFGQSDASLSVEFEPTSEGEEDVLEFEDLLGVACGGVESLGELVEHPLGVEGEGRAWNERGEQVLAIHGRVDLLTQLAGDRKSLLAVDSVFEDADERQCIGSPERPCSRSCPNFPRTNQTFANLSGVPQLSTPFGKIWAKFFQVPTNHPQRPQNAPSVPVKIPQTMRFISPARVDSARLKWHNAGSPGSSTPIARPIVFALTSASAG